MKVSRYATNALFAMSSVVVVSAFTPAVVRQRQHLSLSSTRYILSQQQQHTRKNAPTMTSAALFHSTTSTSTTTKLAANVLKLSDPESQLLNNIDVFIFDCDGVIWRVRFFCFFVVL